MEIRHHWLIAVSQQRLLAILNKTIQRIHQKATKYRQLPFSIMRVNYMKALSATAMKI
jgi:hypothetical protein